MPERIVTTELFQLRVLTNHKEQSRFTSPFALCREWRSREKLCVFLLPAYTCFATFSTAAAKESPKTDLRADAWAAIANQKVSTPLMITHYGYGTKPHGQSLHGPRHPALA